MADDRGSWIPRYLVAIGVIGITTGLVQAVELSTAEMMCSPYLFAVIVTAWFAGLGPAVLAAGLSCVAMDHVFRVHRSTRRIAWRDRVGRESRAAAGAHVYDSISANRSGGAVAEARSRRRP